MFIARLIADPATLADHLAHARATVAAQGGAIRDCAPPDALGVTELALTGDDPAALRAALYHAFSPSDLLLCAGPPTLPRVFVSDMDSTMIAAECIDELADFARLKPQIAAITERAMQGELDFERALRERVALLRNLPEGAIAQCLAERIMPMAGAGTLVRTLRAHGCRTVLVTGGFHHFADPVAAELGFDAVIANRLGVAGGRLTGAVEGPIVDSAAKLRALEAETAAAGEGSVSLAMGDGANDIPMLARAHYGIAYHAKPRARAAADGWIDRGDCTSVLRLLGVPERDWVAA